MDVIFEFEKTAAILFSITYVERRFKKSTFLHWL